jgi:hypothetical protein
MTGIAARQWRNTLRTFTASTRSHSSSVVSTIGFQTIWAALLTRTSSRPKRSTAVANVDRDHGGAALAEQTRRLAADPARRARDDRHLALEAHHRLAGDGIACS